MRCVFLFFLVLFLAAPVVAAPITYQGQLQQQDQPFSGTATLEFRLFDSVGGATQIGPVQTRDGVNVQGGVFQVELDFGVGAFDGQSRWLEVQVNGTVLAPRQPIHASPYAVHALSTGSVPSAALGGLYSNPLSFSNPANTYTGSGAGLTALNASQLTSGSIPSARLGGTYSGVLAFSNASNTFAGSGSGLTALNASNISSGTLADARLSSNIARLNTTQTFTGAKTFTNPANSFTGSGAGLIDLDAGNIAVGTLAEARLPSSLLERIPSASTAPTILGRASIGATALAMQGNYVYAAQFSFLGQVRVVDISAPSSPTLVGSFIHGNSMPAIAAAGSHVYFLTSADALRSLDVSDPASPQAAGSVAVVSPTRGLTIANGHAFVVGGNTLQAFSLADPASPALAGSLVSPISPAHIVVSGNHAFVLGTGGALQVVNISNPASMSQVASISIGGSRLALAGSHLVVSRSSPNEIRVYDISTPASPTQVGSAPLAGFPSALAASGTIVYASHQSLNRLDVYSIADPANPALQGSVDTETSPNSLAVDGDRLAIGHSTALQIMHTSNNVAHSGPMQAAAFQGVGAGLTNLNANHLTTGQISSSLLSGTYSNILTFSNTSNTYFGSGVNLSSLNASSLTTGTVPSARLSGTYSNALTLSSASNSFTGSGAALTSLNASNFSSGTVSSARLSGAYSGITGLGTLTALSVNGDVGIGTTSPTARLHLHQTSGDEVAINMRVGGSWTSQIAQTASSYFNFSNGGQVRMTIRAGGQVGIGTEEPGSFLLAVNGSAAKPGGGSWSTFSDERVKHSVEPLTGTLDRLLSIHGYTFEYHDQAVKNRLTLPGRQTGFLAQELQQVFPEWVESDDAGYLYITERGATALIVEALRDLRAEKVAEIQQLRRELEAARADHDAALASVQGELADLREAVKFLVRERRN